MFSGVNWVPLNDFSLTTQKFSTDGTCLEILAPMIASFFVEPTRALR
jgi:hypothetical protein